MKLSAISYQFSAKARAAHRAVAQSERPGAATGLPEGRAGGRFN
ncbi:MAG: hypothetical protein ACLQVL_10295 [Terriglobia bacterium]